MKYIKFLFILIVTVISLFLLYGCAHDKEKVINHMNQAFGEDAYTMKTDPQNRDRWIITLKEYPQVPFHSNVFHDLITLGSPIVQTDFPVVFSKHVIEEYKQTTDIGSDKLIYYRPLFIYSTKVNSLEEIKTPYDKVQHFIAFVSEKYPILVKQQVLAVRLDIEGLPAKDGDKEITVRMFSTREEKLTITSYEEFYTKVLSELKR